MGLLAGLPLSAMAQSTTRVRKGVRRSQESGTVEQQSSNRARGPRNADRLFISSVQLAGEQLEDGRFSIQMMTIPPGVVL